MGRRHREVWESLGRSDPDWAVLTDPARRRGGWAPDLEAFYGTGRAEVDEVLAGLPADTGRSRATDWGSGTGRLSLALAAHFDQVTSVDVSDPMLATLADRAAQRGVTNVRGVRLDEHRPGADQDLVLCLLVLQHLPDRAAVLAALEAMTASLRPGGRLVVEVPDRALTARARAQPRYRAYQVLRLVGVPTGWLHARGLSGISMVSVDQGLVRATLEGCGATVEVASVVRPGDGHRYVRYVARRIR